MLFGDRGLCVPASPSTLRAHREEKKRGSDRERVGVSVPKRGMVHTEVEATQCGDAVVGGAFSFGGGCGPACGCGAERWCAFEDATFCRAYDGLTGKAAAMSDLGRSGCGSHVSFVIGLYEFQFASGAECRF